MFFNAIVQKGIRKRRLHTPSKVGVTFCRKIALTCVRFGPHNYRYVISQVAQSGIACYLQIIKLFPFVLQKLAILRNWCFHWITWILFAGKIFFSFILVHGKKTPERILLTFSWRKMCPFCPCPPASHSFLDNTVTQIWTTPSYKL